MSGIRVHRKRRGLAWWAWLAIALALAALLWFLFDLFNNDPKEANDLNVDVPAASVGSVASDAAGDVATSPIATSAAPEGVAAPVAEATLTIGELAANPAAYLGQTVTVRGPIEEVITPSAFSLDEDAAFGGGIDNDVLVIGAQQALPGLGEQSAGTEVAVTGVVRQVNVPALEQELGYDLDDALFRNHTFRPAIVAQSIQLLTEGAAAAGNSAEGASAGAAAVPAAPPTGERIFDILTVLNVPDRTQFAGRPAQFLGVYVQTVPSDKVFFAGPAPDNALPVLLNEQQTPNTPMEGRVNVNPGQSVTIVGTIRPLPLPDDVRQMVTLTAADEAALSGQQVFVFADQVIVDSR